MHHRGWGILLAGLLCMAAQAVAQPRSPSAGDASVQVFSKVDRSVVAAGVTFVYEVEVYASPESFVEAVRVEHAFMAAQLAIEDNTLELISDGTVGLRREGGATGPFVLRRRVLLRARAPGRYRIPSFKLHLDGRTYTSLTHQVTAYEVEPDFFEAGAAVLPIAAELKEARKRRTRTERVGSAFLITPDALVTSLHVILDARRVRVTLPNGKTVTTGKAWVVDPVRDVAILHMNPHVVAEAGLTPLELAPMTGDVTTSALEDDDNSVVFTYGWPSGVQRSTAGLRYQGLTLQPGETLWISTNPVRPGDSGGPLLDRKGRVLGVISSGTARDQHRHTLREEISVALDIRPALGQKLRVRRPRSLRALMRDPSFQEHPHVQALRLTTLLSTGGRLPDVETSLAQLDKSVALGTDDARLYFLQGVVYQLLGTGSRAVASYRASLEAYDGHFISSYMLALYYLRSGNYREAERFFRHTLRFGPYDHFATFGLAETLMKRLQYAEAVPLLHAVIAYDPTYVPALYSLALCALALDDEPRARQILVKLEGLSPVSAWRLRRIMRRPVLRPRVLRELPRVPISFLPLQR
ncbi:MAG: trypsin-like peptidase domain-containing protein [Rhodothermales bacterium]